MRDFIPTNDSEFREWMANLLSVMGSHLPEFKITPEDFAELLEANETFSTDLTDCIAMRAAAMAATTRKTNSRRRAESILRPILRQMNYSRGMTNTLRERMRIPKWSGKRSKVALPDDRPAIHVDVQPGRAIIHFGTAPQNELRNGKPRGVKGVNIYRKAPGEDKFHLIACCGDSPYIDEITGPAAEYSYYAQYRGTKSDDLGGMSATVTVAARGVKTA